MGYDKIVNSTQLNGAMTATANAIRERTGGGGLIQWDADTGFANEIANLDEWHIPEGWPNIELLPINNGEDSWNIYFLYDCKQIVRYAGFNTNGNNVTISLAKVVNGVVGDFSQDGAIVSGSARRMPLPDDVDYAVVRLSGEITKFVYDVDSNYGLYNAGNNIGSNQPCLWLYGKVKRETTDSLYINQEAGVDCIYTKRVNLTLINMGIGYGFRRVLDSLVINGGDADGNPFVTGSGGAITTNSDIVILNSRGNSGLCLIDCCDKCILNGFGTTSGSLSLQNVSARNTKITEFQMRTNGLKITNLSYAFQYAENLKKLDLHGCDLSTCTTAASGFSQCYSLESLDLGTGLAVGINISASTLLTKESLLNVLNGLGTVSTATTITLGNTLKSKLSDAEIAIATEKGWTVA